jgi:SAM-dependent methyltransferase
VRDPLGSIAVGPTQIHRNLYQALPPDHFLKDAASRKMVELGQLVPFHFASETEIISPRVPFVTYPHEWCNAQFLDAAELTLALSEAALLSGHELKDASAWNVVFDGCRPVFCDHLSFQRISDRRWWAFAQYIRHFILPLCLSKHRRLHARESLAISRDGMNPEVARNLMGLKRFATRYWLLMMSSRPAATSGDAKAGRSGPTNHKNLYTTTRWFLNGVRTLRHAKSTWLNYTAERNHYTPDAADVKYKAVETWLTALSPPWVIDLGCNTGEFSKLAVRAGSRVIAIDMDHESLQDLYLSNQGEPIYPVFANFDDLSGGRGWAGSEFPGLIERLAQNSDLLMMLAVVHHLAISSAVPYAEIAAIAARLTSKHLIVELLDSSDPLVCQLASQRNRLPSEFSIAVQRQAFDRYFETLEVITIPASSRQLFLMEKK